MNGQSDAEGENVKPQKAEAGNLGRQQLTEIKLRGEGMWQRRASFL